MYASIRAAFVLLTALQAACCALGCSGVMTQEDTGTDEWLPGTLNIQGDSGSHEPQVVDDTDGGMIGLDGGMIALDGGTDGGQVSHDAGTTLDAGRLTYPPARINYSVVPMQSMPLPDYLVATMDLPLGNQIMRITDEATFGGAQTVGTIRTLKHHYAKNQPWNADQSLVFLVAKYPGVLLDGTTFVYQRPMPAFSVNGERVWSAVDPHMMYGVDRSSASFKKINVMTQEVAVIRKFSEYTWLSLGSYEGNLSDDDRYACFMGQRGTTLDLLVYDQLTNQITGKRSFVNSTGNADIDYCTVTPSGTYVAAGFKNAKFFTSNSLQLFDRQFNHLRQISKNQNHVDFGYDQNGDEVVVGNLSTTGDIWHQYIYSARLRDGIQRVELPVGRVNNPTHVSCRNTQRPGWCYVSEFANVSPTNPLSWYTTNSTFGWDYFNYNEVFAVKLDGSGTIERFGKTHHNTSATFNYNTNYGYDRSPMAVPNRDGSRVLFGSDWEDASADAFVHTFVTWAP